MRAMKPEKVSKAAEDYRELCRLGAFVHNHKPSGFIDLEREGARRAAKKTGVQEPEAPESSPTQ